jgi:hypothetical protein
MEKIDLKDTYLKLDMIKNGLDDNSSNLLDDVIIKLQELEFEINTRRGFDKTLIIVNQNWINKVGQLLHQTFNSRDYLGLITFLKNQSWGALNTIDIEIEDIEQFIEKLEK